MSSQIISDQSHPNQTSYCSTMSEKLCLNWNDFQANDNTAFGDLREDLELTDVKIALPDFSVDLMKELDEKVKSLMEFSKNLAPNGPTGSKAKICKVCGKEGPGIAIRDHIEANHLEGLILLAPSGALIAIPTYYWPTPPTFQITLVLNTGLSLSEPL